MTAQVRQFLSSDAFVALLGFATLLCLLAIWRVWRSPGSWHVDGDTKGLRFHGWPSLLMAASGASVFAILTIVTL